MEKIICKTTAKGVQSFYLRCNKCEYYLFSQPYRVSVKEYFRFGLPIKECSNYSSRSYAVRKTLDKIYSHIRYVEKEYGIAVLEKTKQKANAKNVPKSCRCGIRSTFYE